jgi:hypothetical protein
MNETLQSKLARLLQDEHIYRVEINIKCKTRDGMIYTMQSQEYDREDTKDYCITYAEHIDSCTTSNLLEITDIVAKGDGFWFSVEEMVSVKHSEIVRVWAELGDLYRDEVPKL